MRPTMREPAARVPRSRKERARNGAPTSVLRVFRLVATYSARLEILCCTWAGVTLAHAGEQRTPHRHIRVAMEKGSVPCPRITAAT